MPTPTLAVVVNFTQFQLELHVQKSLQRAWALSGGRPVNASHLLKGALLVVRTDRSAAFLKLASLLPLPSLSDVKTTDVPPADLAAMPLAKPVADSFSVAEGFLKDKGTVWGRDYVTLALLAKDDPSLSEIAREANSDVDAIRRAWLEFVCSTDQRRTPDSWHRWWRGAGVPVPAEEKASVATAAAYLFTWNPTRYPVGMLEHRFQEIKERGATMFRWSTGNRSSMARGERVFLVRQGADPRGLVGVGEVHGDVVEGPHWDESERAKGRTSLLVDVRWVALSPEPFLDLSRLIQETGDAGVWSSQAGGVKLEPALAQRLEALWPRAWARHAHGLGDGGVPPLEPRQWIARFDADRGGKGDSLKVERYVHAFARVMASRNLTPPLSIGLFGDWGSGKTFFMDRLFDKIEALSQDKGPESRHYWQRICQIRFNAWHYAETNLWASLVSTIFNELRVFLDGSTEDADEFNRLLNELELAGELRKEADRRLKEAGTQLEDARKRVLEAEKTLAELPKPPLPSDARLRAILAKSLAEVAGADHGTIVGLLKSAAEVSGREEFRQAAERLESGAATVEASRALLEEAQALSSKAGFWWRVLSGAKLHKSRGFWIVIAVVLAIPAIFGWMQHFDWLHATWAHVWTLLGETLTVLGATVAWVRSRLSGASAVFDRLGSFQARIARAIEEARTEDRRAHELVRDAALLKEQEAKARLEQVRREEERAAEVERTARAALRDSTSQARLGRFIRERASSVDYEKHLGLIAMIHRDFERLSDLMEKVRGNEADPGLPRIDRIILYIDDLDRCHPPEKVVKVLEAVHLLLFFPLFVVVVGVDSRWVSRSLYKHYEGMLADEAIAGQERDELRRAPAESQDFLEKIFQVPFWLRRMEPAAVQRLIHSLISKEELEAAPAPIAPAPPSPLDGAPDAPESEGPAGAASAGGQAAGTTAEDPARAAAKRATAEAESELDLFDEALIPPSESLTITEAELSFMGEVAPLMPRTPRSVKRFVNIYRLYKAALSPAAFARFVGTADRPGNFRAVQVLLALVTGTPRFAQRVFRELHGGEGGSAGRLSDLVTTFHDGDETWRTTLEALREFAGKNKDLELDALREVSTLVSRYSVHHMVSRAPGEAGLG